MLPQIPAVRGQYIDLPVQAFRSFEETRLNLPDINYFAAVTAGVVGFFWGGLWYSKRLIGELWNRENGGPHPHAEKGRHPGVVFAIGIALSIVSALALALWLGPEPPVGRAVAQGALAGACFVGASFGINYQFAGRSDLLWAIDAAYHTVQFAIIGLILGLWH